MRGLAFFLMFWFLLGGQHAAFAAQQVVVGPEDTVYKIAYDNGITTPALISANNLKPPYVLQPGQVLILPAPHEHIVGNGENLQTIAESHGVKVDVLVETNNMRHVRAGDHLLIPPRDTESLAEALKPPSEEIRTSSLEPLPLVKSAKPPLKPQALPNTSSPLSPVHSPLPADLAEELAHEKGIKSADASSPESAPPIMGNLAAGKPGAPYNPSAPYGVPQPQPLLASQEEKPQKKKVETKKAKTIVAKENNKELKKIKKEGSEIEEKEIKEVLFMWPVEGKVIGKFGANGKNDGTKNDGIAISVPEGTTVKAAADGEVMYAGSELKGFGNLLLIKHPDGWITAYAHNSKLLVDKGTPVKQGQAIAKSGKPDGAKEAQVEFQIRKGKQPVDPLPKLGS